VAASLRAAYAGGRVDAIDTANGDGVADTANCRILGQ
jgi:hypothetical protein